MLLVGQRGERAGRFGKAVHLQETAFEGFDRAAQQVGRDRRGAVTDKLERREICRARLRQFGHKQHQRRHQERTFDPLLHHGLEQYVRQRLTHNDDGRAGLHGPDCPNRAADMEQRQTHQRTAAFTHLAVFQRPARTHVEQIPSGQHRALWKAGRARRTELSAHGAIGVAPRIVTAARQVVEGDGRHARRGTMRLELRPSDDEFRFDVVDDLLDLVRREPPVDRRRHHAGLVEREKQLEIGRAVLVENADPIAGFKAELAH